MDHLRSIIGKVLHKRGLEREARAAQATYAADRVIAQILPKVATLLHAKSCKQGTLIIAAEHPIAAQECQAKIPELLSVLEKELDGRLVTEIRLVRA